MLQWLLHGGNHKRHCKGEMMETVDLLRKIGGCAVVGAVFLFLVFGLIRCAPIPFDKKDLKQLRVVCVIAFALVAICIGCIFTAQAVAPKCPNCDQKIMWEYCKQCGSRPMEKPAKNKCPGCGKYCKTPYCELCGTKQP